MSTSGAIRLRGTGAGAGHPRGSYIYVAGSPRRTRRRRRAVLLWVASLPVLVPVGVLMQSTAADHTAADHTSDARQITAGDVVPGQQGAAPVNGDQAAPPPEPGAIDPALSRAFSKARSAALKAGLDLQVTSGFRSVATQQALYDDARAKYGSAETARRWVLPPEESNHVKGLAIDVGPRAAAAWLETHGVHYGLCRRYVNEWWHFERLAPAIGQQCPALETFAGG